MPHQALPEGFAPGDHDVVIGKGKKFYFHGGNQWLRQVVDDRTAEYSKATNKWEKSFILSSVIDYIRTNGRFVRLDSNGVSWVQAEDLLCREKCSAVFREYVRNANGGKSSPNPNLDRSKSPVRRPAPVRGLSSRGLSSKGLQRGLSQRGLSQRGLSVNPKKGDSSSDLIKKMMEASISSSNSRNNLKYAMSMSTGNLNLLKPSRSGQFSAAKKQSFSKLSSAVNSSNSNQGMGNATWGAPKPTKVTSSGLRNLLRMNSTPNVMGNNLLQPGVSPLQHGVNLFQPAPVPSMENQLDEFLQDQLDPTTSLGDQFDDFLQDQLNPTTSLGHGLIYQDNQLNPTTGLRDQHEVNLFQPAPVASMENQLDEFLQDQLNPTTSLQDQLEEFQVKAMGQMEVPVLSNTTPLRDELQDFQLNDLKQMDAQLTNTCGAKAVFDSQHYGNQGTTSDWNSKLFDDGPVKADVNQGDDNIDVDALLQMPVMELNQDELDMGMDASNMSAFGDQHQSLTAM